MYCHLAFPADFTLDDNHNESEYTNTNLHTISEAIGCLVDIINEMKEQEAAAEQISTAIQSESVLGRERVRKEEGKHLIYLFLPQYKIITNNNKFMYECHSKDMAHLSSHWQQLQNLKIQCRITQKSLNQELL